MMHFKPRMSTGRQSRKLETLAEGQKKSEIQSPNQSKSYRG